MDVEHFDIQSGAREGPLTLAEQAEFSTGTALRAGDDLPFKPLLLLVLVGAVPLISPRTMLKMTVVMITTVRLLPNVFTVCSAEGGLALFLVLCVFETRCVFLCRAACAIRINISCSWLKFVL